MVHTKLRRHKGERVCGVIHAFEAFAVRLQSDARLPAAGCLAPFGSTVLDRFVQQLVLGVLTSIWEARFSPSSFGFRPGRSQLDAIWAAQKHIQKGKTYVVDLAIERPAAIAATSKRSLIA